ncbi:MAG: ParB/RepB/Spo0J family partition protein [Candidatus Margulisbacteria bacterium]|nr:ParB/RepB/Spo0J family partition protein [Candidatus Margulisiibacteriota bacterium]MBU1021760.1 ParB/RepB/Spo0J family partition protein [Candidatus Margulisiibacteriota bacterium]MBU1729506.1 ParB/RepB/Spo0J family partition protein [Candidatus Margulisiibacteriota bacterium]MBU1955393.1 ParB/RepB/Spo0J family partition protein [Candidatus Margulisiibacteriota bacterium]
MSTQRKALGKGLEALIPKGSVFTGGRTIVNIDINRIAPNPRQPRTTFNQESINELANSIRQSGVAQPILVRMRDGKYELVAGERRFRAVKVAGLASVPAIIKDFSDEAALELAIIENVQREDLNPMDEAEAYQRLYTEFKLDHNQISEKVGKNRTTIVNMLRLLTLPTEIKKSLKEEQISTGHARALLALDQAHKQVQLWNKIIEKSLSVRDVEFLISGNGNKQKKATKRKKFTQNTELKDTEEKLTTSLGTKVRLYGTKDKGKIEVNYYSQDDLERIVEEICKE